ncbi:MAG: hypothetical protein QXT14_02995 [Candidatus Bathyarchaeia archaeon]
MNKTTRDRLTQAWGDETKNWIGRRVRVELVNMNVRGTFRTVIFGYLVATEEDVRVGEARRLLDNMRASGLRQLTTSDLEKFLRISGLKMTVDEFVKTMGLNVKNGVVQL